MKRAEIIEHANQIASEYVRQGLVLTLRQLYYQFVARGLTGNGQKVYNRIGAALTEARYNGTFPIEWIVDRGRSVGATDVEECMSVEAALERAAEGVTAAPYWLRYGRWHGQPFRVWVWVEKDALAGVLEDACARLGVGLFPCKGYPSVSALAAWLKEADEATPGGEEAVILYLGDHDPDGLEIPRAALRSLERLQWVQGTDVRIRMDKIALTVDQIEEYDPPPFPAKVTSSRYDRYVRETGLRDAWELDALEPTVMRSLVQDSVRGLFDPSIKVDLDEVAHAKRLNMAATMREDGWADGLLDDWR